MNPRMPMAFKTHLLPIFEVSEAGHNNIWSSTALSALDARVFGTKQKMATDRMSTGHRTYSSCQDFNYLFNFFISYESEVTHLSLIIHSCLYLFMIVTGQP